MLDKKQWIEKFEKKNGRKPQPSEFIAAKNSREFEDSTTELKNKNSATEPDLEVDGEVQVSEESIDTENKTEDHPSTKKVYCFNCGTQNVQDEELCSSCGVKLNRGKEVKSFFSDLTTKLTEVSVMASQKTKELTQNAQVNTHIYTEKKKRDNLILALGNAYYEKYKNDTNADFPEILSEIKKTDIIIKGIRDANNY
ncbi:TPA: hypothetical protein U1617_001565 [Streptococcus suis]|nr:hypothetical protein [Streptococcus suis]HEM5490998.1 hypothetical protein [Streptococcus suis]